MPRSRIGAKVAQQSGVTLPMAGEIVDFFFNKITETLKNGEEVYLQEFGLFYLKNGKVKFKPGLHLKELISKKQPPLPPTPPS
jgi:nucleoid DNA-binding protein